MTKYGFINSIHKENWHQDVVEKKIQNAQSGKKISENKNNTVLYTILFNSSGLVAQSPIQKGRLITGCIYKDQELNKQKNKKVHEGTTQIQESVALILSTTRL